MRPIRSLLSVSAAICLCATISGCGLSKNDETQIVGSHKPWPGSVMYAVKSISAGQKVKASDIASRKTAWGKAPVDALCFKEEAIGATARAAVRQGEALTFHKFSNVQLKGGQAGPEDTKPDPALDYDGSVVIATKKISKGEPMYEQYLTEVYMPKSRVPRDAFKTVDSAAYREGLEYETRASANIGDHEVVPQWATEEVKTPPKPKKVKH